MHWLTHLSLHYDLVYCLYLGKPPTEPSFLNKKIQFISIPLIRPNILLATWRKTFGGIVQPHLYGMYWYDRISKEGLLAMAEVIDRTEDILFFRLYLFPVLFALKKMLMHKSVRLDLDDVDSLTMKQIARAQWYQGDYTRWLETRIGLYYVQYYEQRVREMADQFYYANPGDKEYLTTQYPDAITECFPNKVLYQGIPIHSTREKASLLFTGTLNYYPNIDAIRFFIREIWPEILRQEPDAELIVAGSHPGRDIKSLIRSTTGCTLVANPISMKDIFHKASLMVVPLRIGGGTRIKILQAFSYGLPVVSTSIGSSGITGADRQIMIIADEKISLIEGCLKIIRNPLRGAEIADNAYTIFVQLHSFNPN